MKKAHDITKYECSIFQCDEKHRASISIRTEGKERGIINSLCNDTYSLEYLNRVVSGLKRVKIKTTDPKYRFHNSLINDDEANWLTQKSKYKKDTIWVLVDNDGNYVDCLADDIDYAMIPYSRGSEVLCADSFADYTRVYNFREEDIENNAERYSTPEIITVLEKRESYLIDRNDPDKRKKMIEEYEKSLKSDL